MADDMTLRPLTAEEWPAWRRRHVADYAETVRHRRGLDAGEATRAAEAELDSVMPDGVDTEAARLLVIEVDGAAAGTLWVGPTASQPDALFVYEIELAEHARGRGTGRRAMVAAEAIAREEGYRAVALAVTGDNAVARGLYASLGYEEMAVSMRKVL